MTLSYFVTVFEKRSDSLLPEKLLATAIKNLRRWYAFKWIWGDGGCTAIALDSDTVYVLKEVLKLYGFRTKLEMEVRSGEIYETLNALFFVDELAEESRAKHVKRDLLNYIVSNATLQNNELSVDRDTIERFSKMSSIEWGIVEKATKSLNNLMLLAMNAKSLRQDAVLAFGYLVLRREPYYVIPLRRAVVAGSRRWGIEAKDIHKAAELIRKNCSNVATIEDLQKCCERVAKSYHAMWRQLLRAVKRHPLYIELYAKTLVKELEKQGADIHGFELWRVRLGTHLRQSQW